MSKKTNEKQTNKDNFFQFPRKLNNLSIILLVCIYTIMLVVVLVSFVPKYDYVVEPDYDHVFNNDIVDPYFKITSTSTVDTATDVVNQKHTILTYLYGNKGNQAEDIKFEYSALYKNGTIDYLASGKRSSKYFTPYTHVLLSNQAVGGDWIDKLFGSVTFTNEATKVKGRIQFAEELIDLKKSEIKKGNLESSFSGKFNMSATLVENTTSGTYTLTLSIKMNAEVVDFHLDVQSFVITEDNDIYPTLGFYNYYLYTQTRGTLSGTSTISKQIKPKYIYVKGIFTNSEGVKTEINYKDEVNNLIAK